MPFVTPGGGSSGAMATDTLWDAKGDLAVATGADAAAKLAVGSQRQVLRVGAASALAWDWPSHIDASTESTTTVVNTITETDLFNLSLTGGKVAAGDYLRVVAYGDMLNNTGGGVTYTLKFYVGTTAVLTTAATNRATSANRRQWDTEFIIGFVTTSSERVNGWYTEGAAAASGWQLITTGASYSGYGTAAEATAGATTIKMTVTMGTASASADMQCHAAHLMLMRKP